MLEQLKIVRVEAAWRHQRRVADSSDTGLVQKDNKYATNTFVDV
jgi:hypothetical protein